MDEKSVNEEIHVMTEESVYDYSNKINYGQKLYGNGAPTRDIAVKKILAWAKDLGYYDIVSVEKFDQELLP